MKHQQKNLNGISHFSAYHMPLLAVISSLTGTLFCVHFLKGYRVGFFSSTHSHNIFSFLFQFIYRWCCFAYILKRDSANHFFVYTYLVKFLLSTTSCVHVHTPHACEQICLAAKRCYKNFLNIKMYVKKIHIGIVIHWRVVILLLNMVDI